MLVRIERHDPQAHQEVQEWRRKNQTGFLINLKSPNDAVLHCTICPHLGDTEWEAGRKNWGSLGNKTKICSSLQTELTDWSKENLGMPLKRCRSCNP
jgi:hypothetical protein